MACLGEVAGASSAQAGGVVRGLAWVRVEAWGRGQIETQFVTM